MTCQIIVVLLIVRTVGRIAFVSHFCQWRNDGVSAASSDGAPVRVGPHW